MEDLDQIIKDAEFVLQNLQVDVILVPDIEHLFVQSARVSIDSYNGWSLFLGKTMLGGYSRALGKIQGL